MLVTPRSTAIEWSDPGPVSTLRPPGYVGHAHFWERALSRRDFVRTAAGASALAVAAGMAWPAAAFAESESESGHNATPRPIPGGTDLQFLLGLGHGPLFHFFFPAFGQEVSTITDFSGSLAAAEIQGSGLGLRLVNDMVETAGGRIEVESTLDRGTTFRVWLPESQPQKAG